MDKLEQVSENPELKQEMEAEVASTNSSQVPHMLKISSSYLRNWTSI